MILEFPRTQKDLKWVAKSPRKHKKFSLNQKVQILNLLAEADLSMF